MQPPCRDAGGEGVVLPLRGVADRHDVDVALQDESCRAVAAGRADEAVALAAVRLGAGKPRVGPKRLEVKLPCVDLEPLRLEERRLPVLQLGLGVGARDARDPDEVDKSGDDLVLVECVQGSGLRVGEGHGAQSRRSAAGAAGATWIAAADGSDGVFARSGMSDSRAMSSCSRGRRGCTVTPDWA